MEVRLTLSRVRNFNFDRQVVTLPQYTVLITQSNGKLESKLVSEIEIDDFIVECRVIPEVTCQYWLVEKIQDIVVTVVDRQPKGV